MPYVAKSSNEVIDDFMLDNLRFLEGRSQEI